MNCARCGAELKEGCIYCSYCGHESQLVPDDYSVFEDDYLRSILREGDSSQKTSKSGTANAGQRDHASTSNNKKATSKTGSQRKSSGGRKKTSRKTPIIIVCVILLLAIITGIVIKTVIDNKNANSYEYQVSMAEKELVDKNYESALNYYKTALALDPQDLKVRMAMTDIYIEQKEYDSAMVLLMEIIGIDKTNKEAYKNLIHIYEEKGDYDSIVQMASDIEDTKILELFEGYIVAVPVIAPEEGEYNEFLDVTLFSVEEYDIYYTINGSDPDAVNGILYDEDTKIKLDKAGTYEIKAVCCNEKGILSEVESSNYVIELLPPDFATLTPDGGRVSADTTVTIMAKAGCSIYYTWDGTDPTEASAKYEAPLEVPEGNNILSVLVVDNKTGLDSGVYRSNFIYYP